MNGLSLIIPIYNERDSLPMLLNRVVAVAFQLSVPFELILIDDHSTDGSFQFIQSYATDIPISAYQKLGVRGKARSLVEGFSYAKYDVLGMIDADLQYPPEAIVEMLAKIEHGCDIVVANRTQRSTSKVRQLASLFFRFFVKHVLFPLNVDFQSGLKLFRVEVLRGASFDRATSWTFDLELLAAAHRHHHSIGSTDIIFRERISGESKISLIPASIEILRHAIRLRLAPPRPLLFTPDLLEQFGQGFNLGGERYIVNNALPVHHSAFQSLTLHQRLSIIGLVMLLGLSLVWNWFVTLSTLLVALTVWYFLDLIFSSYMFVIGLVNPPEYSPVVDIDTLPRTWPTYTILCPLYKEWETVGQFVAGIAALDYPKNRLQVLMLLEEDDVTTVEKVRSMNLPSYFEVIVVPHAKPKTKPKACNYGMRFATGEYTVIYDAEDVPESDQLKKAIMAFELAGPKVACIQAKLNFFNATDNFLTRLFTAEYSFWFDFMLPALQSLHGPIPLGGTSNHFKTSVLRQLGLWDPFNVTEDADIGIRLFTHGYRTAILDSTTYEEANGNVRSWIKQRSRWIKGYMQTYAVHMRRPQDLIRTGGLLQFMLFNLVIAGRVTSALLNPLLWILTLSYVLFYAQIGATVQALFPPGIYYLGMLTLVFGNFLHLYSFVMGVGRRNLWHLAPWALLVPIYWMMMSVASYMAFYEFFARPHYWHKTQHGAHLNEGFKPAVVETPHVQPVPFEVGAM
jgi:cellulose synthase/poly-beta-1,6-N-acetylglucosamine synthase-like glycosyltransferase